jgi:putative transposase
VFPQLTKQSFACSITRFGSTASKLSNTPHDRANDANYRGHDAGQPNREQHEPNDLKPECPRLVELIDARLTAFATRYTSTYPAAMKIVLTDREGLTAYLRFPPEHHHRIRHSNFIERTFGETRRRAKVIGCFPGETSCISIAWAVLDRASRGWRGLTMTPAGLRQLQDLRRSLLQPPQQLRPQHTPGSASSTTETVSATA